MTELEIVALVTTRLHDRFPDLAPRQIEVEVAATLNTFAGSTVHSFLPILVERQALVRLRRWSGRDSAEPLEALGRSDESDRPGDVAVDAGHARLGAVQEGILRCREAAPHLGRDSAGRSGDQFVDDENTRRGMRSDSR